MSKQKEILDKVIHSYWTEIESVMNYIAHSVNLDGVRAEEIKKSLAADITAELTHAQSLAKRIKELGGTVPASSEFKVEQTYLQNPHESTDVEAVIKGVIEAEKEAINNYQELIRMCEGEDYVTQDLIIDNLADEEEHRTIFEGFLKEYAK